MLGTANRLHAFLACKKLGRLDLSAQVLVQPLDPRGLLKFSQIESRPADEPSDAAAADTGSSYALEPPPQVQFKKFSADLFPPSKLLRMHLAGSWCKKLKVAWKNRR
ncbi:hypothetical protein TWF569_002222 [Orbilia oligospora]|uniref:Uncharacterized protein n=1 Tax=Orbilia oligospora TaxID=2813651 RepID=A0A7C8N9W1_ORBOL|nr:hypothetical protein TWF103_003418 [Orbilia oligospora]KAF3092126.1 hypothetical protein TWF102_008535 [Orbilia oligospora]KAF3122265.1 hypothetical protein TWF569_002222 [Orbilia oligospora]